MTVLEKFQAVYSVLQEAGADAELVEFIGSRIEQEQKSRDRAKAKRLETTGGVRKNPADSEFYTGLRDSIVPFLTKEGKTGEELVAEAGALNKKGTPVLAPQVAIALSPLVEDGKVVKEDVKRSVEDKDGLTRETYKTGYKLA